MSHFTVLVALDKSVDITPTDSGDRFGLEFALDQVLERFSENREVEPYREYLDGGPEDFWWVQATRRNRDDYVNGTGIKTYEPGFLGFLTVVSGDSPERQRAQQLEWKEWADRLDRIASNNDIDQLTWLDVISEYDAWKRLTGDNSPEIFHDAESDRAYELPTYNPDSKWDWWTIGGRWAGKFIATPDHKLEDVITARNTFGWNAPPRESWEGRVDGGRVKYVDLNAARDEAADLVMKRYRIYTECVTRVGGGLPWSNYLGRVEAGELTIQKARELYREQPLKKALNETEEFKFSWECPIDEFSVDVEELVARERRSAVTCFSMVTKEGEWVEPGQMGWFGMSSDTRESREAYDVKVNGYLESLDPDDVIVVIDCHI